MATLKQKTAFNKMVENVGNNEDLNMGVILRNSGYSEAMAKNPQKVTEAKGWTELLAQIEEQPLLKRLREMAIERTDKRASLQAIDMLLKLKGRYPNQKDDSGDIDLLMRLRKQE